MSLETEFSRIAAALELIAARLAGDVTSPVGYAPSAPPPETPAPPEAGAVVGGAPGPNPLAGIAPPGPNPLAGIAPPEPTAAGAPRKRRTKEQIAADKAAEEALRLNPPPSPAEKIGTQDMGARIEQLAKETAQRASGEAAVPAATPAATPARKLDLESLRVRFMALSAAGFRSKLLEILDGFGAPRLIDLDAKHFASLDTKLAALENPGV